MTFQFRFIPVFEGGNEHFQHYLCNCWVYPGLSILFQYEKAPSPKIRSSVLTYEP